MFGCAAQCMIDAAERRDDGYRNCALAEVAVGRRHASGAGLARAEGSVEADVVVIGGGFTGLSTALHLREAGVDVAVVEADGAGLGRVGAQ